MLKANAYGHGIKEVFYSLKTKNITFCGVASPEEAIELRKIGASERILLLRPIAPTATEKQFKKELELLAHHQITFTIASRDGLDFLESTISTLFRKKIALHIKVDTGMGRNGCQLEEAEDIICRILHNRKLYLEGIYSHFATADEPSLFFARKQLRNFMRLINKLKANRIDIPIYHIANSGAIFNIPQSHLDMVRPGIALYGYANPNIKGSNELKPAMKLETSVIIAKWLKKGESCGYGRTFIAKRKTRIALLPLGYADGMDRHLSNNGFVSFSDDRIAPIIGRISMDLMAIDISNLPDITTGSPVIVISEKRSMPNSVESIASKLGTIPHEITCSLGERIKRLLID
jgi:alanine racemase